MGGGGNCRTIAGEAARVWSLHWLIAAASPAFSLVLANLAQKVFGSAVWPHPQQLYSDVKLYYQYASQAAAGGIPYRDFAVEYPPASFPFLFVPRLLSGTLLGYGLWFAAELLIIEGLALYALANTIGRRDGPAAVRPALLWHTLFFAALSPIVVARYDLIPMTISFCAAVLWINGRARAGAGMAALGTLVKLYPALCAAPAMLREWLHAGRGGRRGATTFLMALGLGAAAWYLFSPEGARHSLTYHSERGLETESLYAGALIVVGKIGGIAMRWSYDHGSLQAVTPWSGQVARLSLPIQALTLGLIVFRFAVSGMRDPLRYSGGLILGFILTGKVLSPQYLIWLFPFIAALPGTAGGRARALFLLCCVLTTMIFPFAFTELGRFTWPAVTLLNLRNAGLVWLLIEVVRERSWKEIDPDTVPAGVYHA